MLLHHYQEPPSKKPHGATSPYDLHEDMIPIGCREKFITSGYRTENMSYVDCVKTMFVFKCNETFNIWTHLIPFILFGVKFYVLFTRDLSLDDTFYWPLAANAAGILGFCITSSLAHIFCALSPNARYLCFYFDYALISVYSSTGWLAFYFYTRPLNGGITEIFQNSRLMMLLCFKIGIISTFQCCVSRHIKNGAEHFLRVSSFVAPWLFAGFPYLYRLRMCESEIDCDTSSLWHFTVHTVFYVVGAIALAVKLPERLKPGWFNVIGHSHQVMHICVAFGANYQFESARSEMVKRESELRLETINQMYATESFYFTVAVMVAYLCIAISFPRIKHFFVEYRSQGGKEKIR